MWMRSFVLELTLVVSTILGTSFAADTRSDSVRTEVLATENARTSALVNRDVNALDKLLRDDLTYVHASGRVDNKKTMLDSVRSDDLHYISWTPKQINVRAAGEAAVVDGEYAVKVINRSASPETLDLNVFFLAVYLHSNSGWQLIAWQTTRDVRTETK
jgi:hypothetical protein